VTGNRKKGACDDVVITKEKERGKRRAE